MITPQFFPINFKQKMSDSEDMGSDVDEGMEIDASADGNVEQIEISDETDTSSGSDEDSDKDSDDEDDDVESKLMGKYLEILGQISENKYNYDSYVELVEVAQ